MRVTTVLFFVVDGRECFSPRCSVTDGGVIQTEIQYYPLERNPLILYDSPIGEDWEVYSDEFELMNSLPLHGSVSFSLEHNGRICQFYLFETTSWWGLRYHERGIPIPNMNVKGWIFNERGSLLPHAQTDIMSFQLS